MYKAFVDGACRPNPGRGAYGFIIYDMTGREIKRQNGPVGENVTNNIAEYTAVIKALQVAIGIGIKYLVVFSDSQLTVRQLNGEYNVGNSQLKRLNNQALELANQFTKVIFIHIKRSHNKKADALTDQYYSRVAAGQ